MAGVKISALPPGGEIQSTDLLPVARGVTTFSVRGDVIFPVTEPKMGNDSVSNRTLSANVISLDKIRTMPGNRVLGNNTGSQGNVASVQVVEDMIADDAVTSVKIKEGEVKDANILNNTISLGKLQQISANRVLGATVTGNVVQTQIVEGMIADDAVTSTKIKAGEVKRGNIENGAINRDKIAGNEVMFSNIQQIGGTTNSVIGYAGANSNAQAIKISPAFLSTGAPSWDTSGNLTVGNTITTNYVTVNNNINLTGNITVGNTVTTDFITVNNDINLKRHLYIDYDKVIYGKNSTGSNATYLILNNENNFSYLQYATQGLIVRSTTNATESIKINGGTDNRDVTVRGNCAVGGNLQLNGNLDVDGNLDYKDRPMYACRAWVNFDGTRNQANTGPSVVGQNVYIRNSKGISRVLKENSGRYEIFFSSPMANNEYAVVGNCGGAASGQNNILCVAPTSFSNGEYGTASFDIALYENNTNGTEDASRINLVIFGD